MLQDLFLVAAGLVLLFLGGEGLVRGSIAIAERLGISKLLIGLVIVGFGTSTPELLVSVNAALEGAPEIALGNVVGSNIANVLLIIGLAAVITPILGWERAAVREALVATLVSLAAFALVPRLHDPKKVMREGTWFAWRPQKAQAFGLAEEDAFPAVRPVQDR